MTDTGANIHRFPGRPVLRAVETEDREPDSIWQARDADDVDGLEIKRQAALTAAACYRLLEELDPHFGRPCKHRNDLQEARREELTNIPEDMAAAAAYLESTASAIRKGIDASEHHCFRYGLRPETREIMARLRTATDRLRDCAAHIRGAPVLAGEDV